MAARLDQKWHPQFITLPLLDFPPSRENSPINGCRLGNYRARLTIISAYRQFQVERDVAHERALGHQSCNPLRPGSQSGFGGSAISASDTAEHPADGRGVDHCQSGIWYDQCRARHEQRVTAMQTHHPFSTHLRCRIPCATTALLTSSRVSRRRSMPVARIGATQ